MQGSVINTGQQYDLDQKGKHQKDTSENHKTSMMKQNVAIPKWKEVVTRLYRVVNV